MHDVTAQHEASEALRVSSEQQYRLLVESVSDHAIFMLDVAGHVASWTPAAERMMGYRPEEIIGQSFTLFFTPEIGSAACPEQEMRTAELTGRARGGGWRVRKDGSRFWGDEIDVADPRRLGRAARLCQSRSRPDRSTARGPRTRTACTPRRRRRTG